MNPISFISANFVARELDYNMTEGWMQGDTATQEFFKPLKTFEARFIAMLAEIKSMGFNHLDLWGAHLHPNWATPEHLGIAKNALREQGLTVTSLAAWCGDLEALEGFTRVANALDTTIIAGGAPVLTQARAETLHILRQTGVKIAIENHPEKNALEVLAQIGSDHDFIGAAPDTGWWGTQNMDSPTALRELGQHILIVHFKDVKEAGTHQTCRFGDGIVNLKGSLEALQEIGYTGVLGIEHEPEEHNPRADIVYSKTLLETWLGGKR